jgi:hypothetical protein
MKRPSPVRATIGSTSLPKEPSMRTSIRFRFAAAFAAVLAVSALAGCDFINGLLGIGGGDPPPDPSTQIFKTYLADIPDPELRLCLEETIGKSFGTTAGSITVGDLAGAQWLVGKQRNIASLKGLELTDMRSIDMWNCSIADASALRGLNLEACSLDTNAISSLDPFLLSPRLGFLSLSNNPLTAPELRKITPYAFPALGGLNFSSDYDGSGDYYVSFSDALAVLTPFTGLTNIGLVNFHMNDAQFASFYSAVIAGKLQNFACLTLAKNDIGNASLALIAGIPNLTWLNLQNCPNITSLDALAAAGGPTKLNNLYLNDDGVVDFAPLKTMYDRGCFQGAGAFVHIYNQVNDRTSAESLAAIDYLRAHGVVVQY